MHRKQCVQSCAELISANCVKCGRHSISCDCDTFHFYLLVAKTASSATEPQKRRTTQIYKQKDDSLAESCATLFCPCLAHIKRSPACSFTLLLHLLRTPLSPRHKAHSQHWHWQAHSEPTGTHLTRNHTHTHTLMYSRLVSLPPLYTHTH